MNLVDRNFIHLVRLKKLDDIKQNGAALERSVKGNILPEKGIVLPARTNAKRRLLAGNKSAFLR